MRCPVCNVELSIAERQGIEIDYCPKCRGVWLDRGELDKIIERSMHNMHEDSDDYYKYDRDYEYKRKRSFWRDMFDFD
jgi:hypothetical protein